MSRTLALTGVGLCFLACTAAGIVPVESRKSSIPGRELIQSLRPVTLPVQGSFLSAAVPAATQTVLTGEPGSERHEISRS